MTAKRDGRFAQMRTSLWFMPLSVTAGLAALTMLLLRVRPVPETAFAEWAFPADASAATSLLQTVASAAMTAASLTFSLTVVALQLASQQFSPRLLRQFARDRLIQATMAALVSAFVTALLTMRGLDPVGRCRSSRCCSSCCSASAPVACCWCSSGTWSAACASTR